MAKSKLVLLFSVLFSASIAKSAQIDSAKNPDPHAGEAFVFYVENDSRNIGGPGSDQAYSNGLKISYIYAEDRAPLWPANTIRALQFFNDNLEKADTNFGISLGHQIYTPNKTNIKNLITDDRPYAGWLYVGIAASFKNEKTAHFFEIDLGMIGPSGLGEPVQNNFHDLIKEPHAEGWDNSLHDEPTLQLLYQKRFKVLTEKNVDAVTYYGSALGNVQIGAHVGSLLRFGINLPDDFGPGRPSAGDGDSFVTPSGDGSNHQNSYYVFAGIRGNALARNIFLDGNTFRSSHHVKKYPFTFDTEFGAGADMMPIGIVWRFVTRSPEFEQRSTFNSFASLNITYFF